jgi:two-component system response regulator DesR
MDDQNRIKVLCVDDNPRLTSAWEKLIAQQPDMEVVGTLARADELLPMVELKHADVVLMDLTMDGRDPLEALTELSAKHPGTRTIIYSGYSDPESVEKAVQAGAWGYVDKGRTPDRILDAIRKVARGEAVLP